MKIKRLISITLAFALVFTTMAFAGVATVSADGWTDVVQNFDELTELNPAGLGFSNAVLEDMSATDAEHKKVVKLAEGASMQVNLGTLLSGTYIARASIMANSTAQRLIGFFITTGGNDAVIATQKDNQNLYVTREMNSTAQWVNQAKYDVNVWYDIESVVDVDAGYYSIKIMKDGETLAYKNGLPLSGNPNCFRFTTWNGTANEHFYIDNVEFIAADNADNTVIINEDFSKYTTVNGTPINTALANNGWTIGTNGVLTDAEAALSGGALEVKAGKTVRWQTPYGIPAKGKIKIATKINPVGANNKIIFDVLKSDAHNRNGSGIMGAMFANSEKQIWTKQDGGWADGFRKYRVSEFEAGKWYDLSMVLDMTTNKYTVQVSHDGSVLGQLRDIPFDAMSVYGIQVTNWASDGSAFIDDLKIEYITYETDADRVLTSDDFSKVTADNYKTYGWLAKETFGTVTANEYASLIGKNIGDITRLFGGAATGKYKVSFSARLNGGKLIVNGLMKPNGSATDATAWSSHGPQLVLIDTDKAYHRYTWKNDGFAFANVNDNEWYDFEILVDMDEKIKEITITDQNGAEQTSGTVVMTQVSLANNPTDEEIAASAAGINYFAGVCFRNWTDEGETASADIDNVKVEYYVAKPELSAKKITFTDVKDAVAENTNAVNPALKNIALDFGTVVTESSAADITVTGGTKAVGWSGAVSGNKYILTPDTLLEANTTYTISVPATVGTDAGTFLGGNGYTFEFTTGEIQVDNKITSIKNTTLNKDVTVVADLVAGNTLTVSTEFVNPTSDAQSVAWIIAYYSENGLIYKTSEAKSTSVAAGAATVADQTFTVPDMTGIDKVKVFLWDSIEGLRPYAMPIVIGVTAE